MVYVFALKNVESGGPELLHQLVYVLTLVGVPAKIVYIENRLPFEVVDARPLEAYEKYQVDTESDIGVINQEGNIVVLPEIAYGMFDAFDRCIKVAWWLSVDGYIEAVKNQHGVTSEDISKDHNPDYYGFKDRPDIIHLAQSYYAVDFLRNNMMIPEDQIDYLSDYLNDIYLEGQVTDNSQRQNMVIFNPAKGGKRLRKLIDTTRDEIFWYPLENMTREKVRAAMNLAKVYIDVGEHPGKDRIPREAAMSGCCVITGRRGAAAFHEDVPIPDEYKFDDREDVDVDAFKEKIIDIFEYFDERQRDFDGYRDMIRGEKEKFVMDVIRIFR